MFHETWFKEDLPVGIDAKHHFTRAYAPADEETRSKLEGIARALRLIDDGTKPSTVEKTGLVLADFAHLARIAEGNPIVWSQDRNHYLGKPYAYDLQRKVFEALLEYPMLRKKGEGNGRDKASVYEILFQPPQSLRFKQHGLGKPLVVVKSPMKHRIFDRKTVRLDLSEFGDEGEYRLQEMRELVEFYAKHPLVHQNGSEYHFAHRVFTNGSLRDGGRIFGAWQQLKVRDGFNRRLEWLTIDGQELIEIDIRSCFLFLVHAKLQWPQPLPSDPYAVLASTAKYGRDATKDFINGYLCEGGFNSFPRGFREQHKISDKDRISDWLKDLWSNYPFLKDYQTSAGELMFTESELLLSIIKDLKDDGIVAYGIHDGLLVKASDEEKVIFKIKNVSKKMLGSKPKLQIKRKHQPLH